MKNWKIIHEGKDKKNSIDEIISILLKNRGLTSKKEIDEFLEPKLQDVSIEKAEIDKKEIDKSLKRIKTAIENNEKIAVFGDYDVDGICGAAILFETIYKSYKKITAYIPDRFTEGYGLSSSALDNLLSSHPDVKLIITVDNGIVAYESVEYASKKNIDVIITDHHVKGDKELKSFSTVHTTKLCGAGVAYLFSKEISKMLDSENSYFWHLDLVALATIADLVPLVGPNRALVRFGLIELQKTQRPGLQELFNIAKIQKESIGTYEIGHVIGPRLNAAGRLFSAMDALRLICTRNRIKAQELALALNQANKERQALTETSSSHAKLAHISSNSKKIVFVHHSEYSEGIIGLIASRLVEQYYLPSFVIAKGESISKGSARSISGVNIIEMIRSVSEHILQAGGHPMAAGFTLDTSKIEELKTALEKKAEEVVKEEFLQRVLSIDMELYFEEVTYNLSSALQSLSPFGMGNHEPIFISKNVTIADMKPVGAEGKHLKLTLTQCPDKGVVTDLNCIAFGIGERAKNFKVGDTINIAYTISEDRWNGKKRLQLKIRDIKPLL